MSEIQLGNLKLNHTKREPKTDQHSMRYLKNAHAKVDTEIENVITLFK